MKSKNRKIKKKNKEKQKQKNKRKNNSKLEHKLKILAAGDIHGDTKQAEKLAKKAKKEKVDLVILTGDLTLAELSTENLLKPFVKRNEEVLIIPGNHETIATTDFLSKVYKVKNLHGYSIKKGNIGIFGAGGANIGLFQLNEKEIYDLLKKSHKKIKSTKKQILVSHVHPSETKMEKLTDFFPGSPGLTRAIKKFKPDIALCSHVHEAAGIEEKIGKTRIINVGREGKIIEI